MTCEGGVDGQLSNEELALVWGPPSYEDVVTEAAVRVGVQPHGGAPDALVLGRELDPTNQHQNSVEAPHAMPRRYRRALWFAVSALVAAVVAGLPALSGRSSPNPIGHRPTTVSAAEGSTDTAAAAVTSTDTAAVTSTAAASLAAPVSENQVALAPPFGGTRGPGVQPKAVAIPLPWNNPRRGSFPPGSIQLGDDTRSAAGPDGVLYISDSKAGVVYQIDAGDRIAWVVAGARKDSLPASTLFAPGAMVVDAAGTLFIVDQPSIQRTIGVRDGGRVGRLIRIEPNGSQSVVLRLTRQVRHMYTDDIGNIYLQSVPSTLESSRNDLVLKVSTEGKVRTQTIPLPFRELVPLPRGRWLAVGQFGALRSISLFGSPTDVAGPDFRMDSEPIVRRTSTGFVAVTCDRRIGQCVISILDEQGVKGSTLVVGDVADVTSRLDGATVVLRNGRVMNLRYGPEQDGLTSEVVNAPRETLVNEQLLAALAVDLRIDPVSVAAGPDGTVYWIESSLAGGPVLTVMSRAGVFRRVALPEDELPIELVAGPNSLVFRDRNSLFVRERPFDQLFDEASSPATPTASVRLSVMIAGEALDAKRAPVLASNATATFVRSGNDIVNITNSAKYTYLSRSVRAFDVDDAGFLVFADSGGSRLFGAYAGQRPMEIVARSSDPVNTLVPRDQIGTVNAITSVNVGSFVVADRKANILKLVQRTTDDRWQVSDFQGTQPGPVSASRSSQEVGGVELLTSSTDGSVVMTLSDGTIRRIDPGGTLRVIAGRERHVGLEGRPVGIAVLPNGIIAVADPQRHRVVSIDSVGQRILAGTGVAGNDSGDLDSPTAVGVLDGQMYVVDSGNRRTMQYSNAGEPRMVTRVTRTGDQTPFAKSLERALGENTIIVDGIGDEIVSVTKENRVVRRRKLTGVSTVVAGTGELGYQGDGAAASQARLSRPTCLAAGPDGSIYICDSNNGAIRRVSPDGRISTVVGGPGDYGPFGGLTIDSSAGLLFTVLEGGVFRVTPTEMDRVAPRWAIAGSK